MAFIIIQFLSCLLAGYLESLLSTLATASVETLAEYKQQWNSVEVPPTLSSQFVHPSKSEAAATYASRFNTVTTQH